MNKWVSEWLCHKLSYLSGSPMDCKDRLSPYPIKHSLNVISQMWFQLTLSTTRRGFNTLTTHILPITQRWPYFLKSSGIFRMTLDSIYWKIFLLLENSSIFSTISLSGLLVSLEILWQRLPNWKRNKRKPTFIFEKCSLFPKVLDPPSSAFFLFVPLTIILIAWFASKVCIFGSHFGILTHLCCCGQEL